MTQVSITIMAAADPVWTSTQSLLQSTRRWSEHEAYSDHEGNASESQDDATRLVPPDFPGDEHWIGLYHYYQHRGMRNLILAKLLHLLKMIVTVVIGLFLVELLDTATLSVAVQRDGDRTVALAAFVHFDGFSFPTLIATLAFVVYLAVSAVRAYYEVHAGRTASAHYRTALNIDDEALQTMDWADVSERIVQYAQQTLGEADFDQLALAQCILRHDNYMIALVDGVGDEWLRVDDAVAAWWPRFIVPRRPNGHRYMAFTRSIRWSLQYALVRHVFQASRVRNDVHSDFDTMLHTLVWRMRTLALFQLCMAPFALVYVSIMFVLQYGEQLRTQPGVTVGIRQWSHEAVWRYREYNELPHILDRRLRRAYKPAQAYVNDFSSRLSVVVAQFVSFSLGALVGLILLAGVYDDRLVTHVEVLGRSGLWWAGVLGVALAAARALVPNVHALHEPRAHLHMMARHTHYLPRAWHGMEHRAVVRDQVFADFPYRLHTYMHEALDVVVTPLLLWFVLPTVAPRLLRLFRDSTVATPYGDTCAAAAFVRDDGPNDEPGGSGSGAEGDKLTHSLVSFRGHHPQWRHKDGGSPQAPSANLTLVERERWVEQSIFNVAPDSIWINSV